MKLLPLNDERDPTVLGLLRVGLGALLVIQSATRLSELWSRGYFGDVFHLPILPAALVPSAAGYAVLQGLALLGGVTAVLGVRGREGLVVSALIGLYLLLCNRLEYHNNRFALFLLAFLAAFTPCDRSFLVRRSSAHAAGRPHPAPFFAVGLIRLQVAAIYLSSGLGKLTDPDWRDGQTMAIRFERGFEALTRDGVELPGSIADIYLSSSFASIASKAAIATELFLALGLLVPKARAVALYVGVLFHLGIELSARVELFSYVMGVAYVAFVVPERRERVLELDPERPLGRLIARALPWVDWLERFRVDAGKGRPLALTDRSGLRASGVGVLAPLARAIPLLFPLWLPVALAAAAGRPLLRPLARNRG